MELDELFPREKKSKGGKKKTLLSVLIEKNRRLLDADSLSHRSRSSRSMNPMEKTKNFMERTLSRTVVTNWGVVLCRGGKAYTLDARDDFVPMSWWPEEIESILADQRKELFELGSGPSKKIIIVISFLVFLCFTIGC